MKSAGVLLLSYSNPDKLNSNYQNAWQGLQLRAVNSVQMGGRALISSSDGLSHGIESFSTESVNILIWAPNCASDTICAKTLDRIKALFK